MRLEWIDDILAVLDNGSLARAAEKRLLTQSAFTRRVRLIEDSIGTELFDRRRKPVTVMAGVEALAPEMRDLSLRLRKMRYRLKTSSSQTNGKMSIACQHAITTTVSPWIVRAMAQYDDMSVRVRSGNQDECMVQLLSGEVDFAVMYTVPGDQTAVFEKAFETRQIGSDMLVPVCAPSLEEIASSPQIPVIGYPGGVFLGQVFDRMIAPRFRADITIVAKAETALTLAAYEFALGGLGVAWLPRSLVASALAHETLVSLEASLPMQALEIRAFRLRDGQDTQTDSIWHNILTDIVLPANLKRFPDAFSGHVQTVERTV
jgi:DNA-binding transcriptional LysR family regulator